MLSMRRCGESFLTRHTADGEKAARGFSGSAFRLRAFGVLTFLTPNLSYHAKLIYAAVTYIGCSVLYTGINTPVTSILSALTTNPQERVTLTSFRMFGSKFGVLLVNLTALRLVQFFGHGNDRRGFAIVMPIYAVGSILLFLFGIQKSRGSRPRKTQITSRS